MTAITYTAQLDALRHVVSELEARHARILTAWVGHPDGPRVQLATPTRVSDTAVSERRRISDEWPYEHYYDHPTGVRVYWLARQPLRDSA